MPYIVDESNEDRYPNMFPIVPRLGDLNHDGIVNIFDAIQATSAFGSSPGQPNWNSQADLNEDDVIDIFDLIVSERRTCFKHHNTVRPNNRLSRKHSHSADWDIAVQKIRKNLNEQNNGSNRKDPLKPTTSLVAKDYTETVTKTDTKTVTTPITPVFINTKSANINMQNQKTTKPNPTPRTRQDPQQSPLSEKT
jgi:hypothetical protein